MNNQEAISILESIDAKTDYFLINDDARAEALDMAISALQAQDVPDTNVGDMISRQAAIDAIYETFCYAYCDNCEKEMNEDLCGDCHRKYQNWSASKKTIEKVINNLPSAQPEPHWTPGSKRLP